MSTNTQLELHPDAESFNAFAEHLLPEHERQPILAHLATCARCRQILSLAQDAAEPEPQAAVGHVLLAYPKRQTANSRLAWGALAACAALATISIVLYPRHPAHTSEQAKIEVPRRTSASPQAPPPTAPQVEKNKQTAQPLAVRRRSGPDAKPAAQLPAAPTAGLDFAAAPTAAKPIAQQQASQSLPNASSTTTLNITLTPAQTSQTVSVSAENALLEAATTPLTEDMSTQIAVPTDQVKLKGRNVQSLHRAQAAPKSTAIAGGAGNGLSAGAAGGVPGGIARTPAPTSARSSFSRMVPAPLIVSPEDESAARSTLQKTLPSGLPAVSAVSASHHLLALDSAGTLFISEDAGAVWEPAAQPWTGRAVSIAISPPTATLAPQNPAKSHTETPPASIAPPRPSNLPVLFEIATDKDAYWTSLDGRNWKTK